MFHLQCTSSSIQQKSRAAGITATESLMNTLAGVTSDCLFSNLHKNRRGKRQEYEFIKEECGEALSLLAPCRFLQDLCTCPLRLFKCGRSSAAVQKHLNKMDERCEGMQRILWFYSGDFTRWNYTSSYCLMASEN